MELFIPTRHSTVYVRKYSTYGNSHEVLVYVFFPSGRCCTRKKKKEVYDIHLFCLAATTIPISSNRKFPASTRLKTSTEQPKLENN